jgi:hypothetical protein
MTTKTLPINPKPDYIVYAQEPDDKRVQRIVGAAWKERTMEGREMVHIWMDRKRFMFDGDVRLSLTAYSSEYDKHIPR